MTTEQLVAVCSAGTISWVASVVQTVTNNGGSDRKRARHILCALAFGWAALPLIVCYAPIVVGRWVRSLWAQAELPSLPRPRILRRAPELGAGQLSTVPEEPGQLSLISRKNRAS